MTSPVPQQPVPKSGNYLNEVSTFTDMNALFRAFMPRMLRVSKNSPPVLNVDVKEGEIIWDRTLSRLYTVSNQTLKYVAFT